MTDLLTRHDMEALLALTKKQLAEIRYKLADMDLEAYLGAVKEDSTKADPDVLLNLKAVRAREKSTGILTRQKLQKLTARPLEEIIHK